MEEIKEELNKIVEFYDKKNSLNELDKAIKEKKDNVEELKKQIQLKSQGPLKDIATEKYEEAEKELEEMKKDRENKANETEKKLEDFKKDVLAKIRKEMKKYKRKKEIDNLKSSKQAYQKMAYNAKRTVVRLVNDFNDGKIIDQSQLANAKQEMKDCEKREKKLEKEIEGYIEIDSNIEQYEYLEELKSKMTGLRLEILEDRFDIKDLKEKNKKQKGPKSTKSELKEPKVENLDIQIETKATQKIDEKLLDDWNKDIENEKTEVENEEPEVENEKPEVENEKPEKVEPDKELLEKAEAARKQIDKMQFDSTNDKNNTVIHYFTADSKGHLEVAKYKFRDGEKEQIIIDALKTAYPNMKDQELSNEFAKYKNADPNIVKLLAEKGNANRLVEYGNLLNKKIIKKDKAKEPLYIEYDISKLSKSNMSDEEKQELENYAFQHRDIAKIKKNLLQTIKFAFRSFKEKTIKSKNVKALNPGVTVAALEDKGLSDDTKQKIQNMVDEKNKRFDEKNKRFAEIAKRANDEFLKQTDSWRESIKTENSDNKIETKAVENLEKNSDKGKTDLAEKIKNNSNLTKKEKEEMLKTLNYKEKETDNDLEND